MRNRQRFWQRKAELKRVSGPYADMVAGAYARRIGQSPVNCPYILDTKEWKCWLAGWQNEHDRYAG